MPGYLRFGTFAVIPPDIELRVVGVGVPHVWRIETAADPPMRHWFSEDGRSSATLSGSLNLSERREFGNRSMVPGRQVCILARNESVAREVQSLMYAGTVLGYPDLTSAPESRGVYEAALMPKAVLQHGHFCERFQLYRNAHYGVRAAAGAWGRSEAVYALEKYRFSLALDSFTLHSGSPANRQVFANRYDEAEHLVAASFAIVAAFSVVEELGLEPRSSNKNPRFFGSPPRWNPVVLSDLNRRLEDAGVPGDTEIIWLRRGSPTRIEREMKPKFGKRCSWNWRDGVRDRALRIADAIHYVSWQRNYVAAHKFRALATAMSPYDVHNAQLVARRLLLGRLGLWMAFSANAQGAS